VCKLEIELEFDIKIQKERKILPLSISINGEKRFFESRINNKIALGIRECLTVFCLRAESFYE
jgi:hypothetical protein